MKKYFYMLLTALIMVACSKDELSFSGVRSPAEILPEAEEINSEGRAWLSGLKPEEMSSPTSLADGSGTCTIPSLGVTYANGMLCFPSSVAFRGTYAALSCQWESYTGYDAYMTLYKGDLYRIDSVMEARGIDEDKPLADFEGRYAGFASLRRQLENAENAFLASGGMPESSSNPGQHAVDDPVFNTLLNNYGCLKVGDTIVKIFSNGVAYLVTDGNMSTLAQLSDIYATQVFRAPNVIALWNEDTTDISGLIPCLTRLNWKTADAPHYNYTYSGRNYKFCTFVKVTNVPFFHAYTALSKNYVWKDSRWKKARMYLFSNVKQALKTCRRIDYTNARFPGSGYKYRKQVRAIYKSNIFHLLNQGSTSYYNTLYIAGEKGNLRAVNGLKYGSTSITRTVILSW